ncbi:Signal recognition particle 68 kDa protein [Verticillium dahliae VDG2]|nr:Signal recognition particle 68 kDa protein [Verticillium dahliae VDG2]
MPPIKLSLNGQNLTIPAVPLTPSAFAPFGDVIQNPHPAVAPSATLPPHLALRAAVTYGAGTWHAPMVALGPQGTSVEFVVTQFANGVADEDCQEVVLGAGEDGSVVVQVPERTGLGGLAKL